MKKTILSIAAFLMVSASSFAQSYVQAAGNTGFTYDCDLRFLNTGGSTGDPDSISWALYTPTCDFAFENGGGGTDDAPVNELKFAWGQSNPGKVYLIMTFATPLDLSAAANQHARVTLRSTLSGNPNPLTYQFKVEDAANTALINPINFTTSGTNTVFNFDLGANIASGQSLASVKKFIFYYERCPSNTVTNDDLFISAYSAGSSLVTAINNSSSVANANLFPNPSTGTTTVSGELKSVADVKITLVDMLGQEVKVIAQERTSTINATFDVTDLKKGIYTVVTNIDGAPAKSQMLVVR